MLERIVGRSDLRVNSFHHQGVRRVADSLAACATAADGLVEAVEGRSAAFALGVQWHPERRFIAKVGTGRYLRRSSPRVRRMRNPWRTRERDGVQQITRHEV